jgi:hypothetical protein
MGRWVVVLMLLGAAPALAKDKPSKALTAKLVLKISPPEAEVFVDGERKGTAGKVHEVPVAPGTHEVTVKYKGDEHTREVALKRNQSSTIEWAIEESKPMPDNPLDSPSTDEGGEK